MRVRAILAGLAAAFMTCVISQGAARAQTFNWQQYKGQTISFLNENNPWWNQLRPFLPEFEKLTGIHVQVVTFQEQQMRQRLVTILQSKSPEVDAFMSLTSHEWALYSHAGWYADLGPLMKGESAPDYDLADFSPALIQGETYGGKLIGIPLNIEGPIIFYRKDIFRKCGVAAPQSLADLEQAAARIKACEPHMVPWVTRGLAPALPYTFSNVLHNFGADYFDAAGKPDLCAPKAVSAIAWYADMLRKYGPPGVVNYSYVQIADLYGQGRAAMAFESSNEFTPIVGAPGRSKDTGLMLLPAGDGGSKPTVIGWGLSMSAFSKHRPATWFFMQWATTRKMEGRLALKGIAPPRASVASSPAYKAWLDALPVRERWQELIEEMAKSGTSEVGPPVARQSEAREIVGQAIDHVLLGQASAKAAACQADKDLEAMLAGH
ncbi:MAG: ABC transporter substrate-binding protein [Acetobacteraceae bacterium]